jgi:predicted chitinase
LVIVAVTGLLHQDNAGRAGNGGGESLRISPSAGMPDTPLALALAVAPLAQEMLIWVGWVIHAAFTVFVAVNRDMAGVFLALVTHQTNKLRSFLHPVLYSVRVTTRFYAVRINAWLKTNRRAGLRKKEQRHKAAAT